MVRTGFLLLLALTAAAGVAWCQTEADFARADRLPLPPSGVWSRDVTGGEECLGCNPDDGSIVFESGGYIIEGLGEAAPITLAIVDADTGVERETLGVADDEERADWIRGSLVPASESFPDAWGSLYAVARPMSDPPSDSPASVEYRFYLGHGETGWLKPLAAEGVLVPGSYRPFGASDSELVGGGSVSRLGESGALALRFFRLPPSNWDNGGTVHIYVGPEVSAQFMNEVGFSYYGAGDYGMALAAFAQAVTADPGHPKAMYNAACSAALLGDVALSLEYLTKLKAQGSATAVEYLAKVDSDSDFDSIRSRSEFTRGLRSIRGTAR